MPSIALKNVAAGTANAVQGLRFQRIPPQGALLTVYASTAIAGGNIDVGVESEEFGRALELNVEIVADAVDTDRDLVMDREPVPGGDLFVAVNTQVCNLLIIEEYLPG